MELNWNFQRGWGIQAKKPSMVGAWIFSGTTRQSVNEAFHSRGGIVQLTMVSSFVVEGRCQ